MKSSNLFDFYRRNLNIHVALLSRRSRGRKFTFGNGFFTLAESGFPVRVDARGRT